MRLLTKKETKNILLSSILAFSIFFSGCSSDLKDANNLNQVSNIQDTSIEEGSSKTDILSYDELIKALKNGKVPEYVLKATVDRVVDGDTVKLKFEDGTNESLRILLIDTPEDTKEKQYLGDLATNFAKENLKKGDTVYVETDGAKTDKYGRYLGYLWYDSTGNKDYKMYNEEVVREGLARVGYIYDAVRHLDKMKKSQYEAQKSKKNIWEIDGYVTDKGFNQSLISNLGDGKSTNSKSVYVNTSSKKYHSTSNAHGMKNSNKMTESEAKQAGYSACKTCYN